MTDDLKERLRARKVIADAYGNAGSTLVNPDGERAIARIEELEAENFALAAQQCLFSDGSGLSGDEWGHQYCAMKRRAEAAEAKLATARNDALEEAALELESWYLEDGTGQVVGDCVGEAIRALKSTTQP